MEDFTVDGIRLSLPSAVLTPNLRAALAEGRYEGRERRALKAVIRPGDRVLDIGAGAGAVSVTAARIVGAGHVTAVEAHPDMLPVLSATLAANGQAGVQVIGGAVVADADLAAGGRVAYHLPPGFWSAGLSPHPKLRSREVTVPAFGFGRLLVETGATAVTMDIEGAEARLLTSPLPPLARDRLRAVIVEVHRQLYGDAPVNAIADALASGGLSPSAELSQGDVMVFVRD